MVENFTAHITPFGLDRNTFVYLPDDWQSSGRRYPVVYMFDGHNLFFDSTATYGTCWGLKEYMDAHPQAIIVAPECNHEGNARLEEYSPYDFVWQEYDIKGRGGPRQGVYGLDGSRIKAAHRRKIPHAAGPGEHSHRWVEHGRADEPVRRHGA